MKKIDLALTIVVISGISAFLTSCTALDDLARLAAKQGSHVEQDVAEQVAKRNSVVVPVVPPKNLNQSKLVQCSRQTGKSAVIEAWNLAKSSGSQVEENYLLNVARDAIQKCTVGRVGDQILDELANSIVAEFKQENLQAQ